jgi:hypothetical protein
MPGGGTDRSNHLLDPGRPGASHPDQAMLSHSMAYYTDEELTGLGLGACRRRTLASRRARQENHSKRKMQ